MEGFTTIDGTLAVSGGEVEEYHKIFQTVDTEEVLLSSLVMEEDTIGFQEIDVVGMVDGDPATVYYERRWWIHARKGTATPAQVDTGVPFTAQETGTAFTSLVWYSVEIPASDTAVRVKLAGVSGRTINWIAHVRRQRLKR